MKSVTKILNSVPQTQLVARFGHFAPDSAVTIPVPQGAFKEVTPFDSPQKVGSEFHRLLKRISDHGPLTEKEREYLPFLSAARRKLREFGVWKMEAEAEVTDRRSKVHGFCDLLVRGGFQRVGNVDFKVVTKSIAKPRPRDVAQLASYAHTVRHWAGASWGALVYIQFQPRPQVRLFVFGNMEKLEQAAGKLVDDAYAKAA